MYSIPKNINIMGKTIDIVIITNNTIKHIERLSGETNYGFYSAKEQKIFIKGSLEPKEMFYTLIHEILHALLDISGHNSGMTDEERYVLFIEKWYVPIIEKLLKQEDTKSSILDYTCSSCSKEFSFILNKNETSNHIVCPMCGSNQNESHI